MARLFNTPMLDQLATKSIVLDPAITRTTGEDGEVVLNGSPRAVNRVIDASTASLITSALEDVVSPKGTAKAAMVPGYRVAGKTGTAQKPNSRGGYSAGKYVVSFIGYLPADSPQLACIVVLDDAQTKPGENYGGIVAGPIFSNIARRSAQYLGIRPSNVVLQLSNNARENSQATKHSEQYIQAQTELLD